MFITIITDCKGQNEAGRQVTRYHTLGLGQAHVIGINSGLGVDATIEAAGNLIDTLDASLGEKGTIVVNVAPRGVKKDGKNGNYFCYFWYKKTLVISSTKGYCLSLVKKFDVSVEVSVLHTEDVLQYAVDQKLITDDERVHIENTQFRSFEFVPRVAKWLHDKVELPSTPMALDEVENIEPCIWCIDAFGNGKTTILSEEVPRDLETNLGTFPLYERMKDIPDGQTAFYIGSSGLGNKRFLEIATQNREGSAAKCLKLKVGKVIRIKKQAGD